MGRRDKAARELRERLADIKLKSFVKTTGGKGLHVVVPTNGTPWDDDEGLRARDGAGDGGGRARSLRREDDQEHPRGKIFLDYLRNGRGATAIVAYSTRARPGATVSTPVAGTNSARSSRRTSSPCSTSAAASAR